MSGGGGFYRYQCDCRVQQRHECPHMVHQNGDMCAECQAGECGQSIQTTFRHIQHVVAVVSGPIDIFTSKGQTQVQACRALEPYEIGLRDNARRNGMLLSQGNADSEEFHIVAEFSDD